MKIKVYFKAMRAPFFTASIIPIVLGTAVAWWQIAEFDLLYFLAALLGGVALHAGSNLANDYFDHKSRADEMNGNFISPFTGGSRVIQNGLMSAKAVLIEALICYFIAALVGFWLILVRGFIVLILGLIGLVSGFFYTAPPLKFVARGFGEILIALNFGLLTTFGAYFIQTGFISWQPIIPSIPISLLIAAVVYANEFPDYMSDVASKKLHIVARLGHKKSAKGYAIIMIGIYFSLFIGILTSIPFWSIITFLTIPMAVETSRTLLNHATEPSRLRPVSAATIKLHLLIGLILSASYIISALL